jgi:hypothetical protein
MCQKWDIFSGPRQAHPYSVPYGQPSLTYLVADSWMANRKNHYYYKMTINYVVTMLPKKRLQSKMSIHLQLAAIFKRFELRGWGWAHFLRLFKFFSDLTNFLKIHSLRIVQMIEYSLSFAAFFWSAWLSILFHPKNSKLQPLVPGPVSAHRR